MSRRPVTKRELAEGIDMLAREAGKARPGRAADVAGFELTKPAQALARDEILVLVADAKSVALKRMKRPAPRPTGTHARPHGLQDLARRIAGLELIATELEHTGIDEPLTAPPLTEEEERVLRSGGLDPTPLGPAEIPLRHRGTVEYARLVNESYTVEQAARLLGVNTSRIRQRLTGTPRTLYGIKFANSWRLPTFQFSGRRVVPHIDAVIPRLPANLHPVAVYRWFTSPSSDLQTTDGATISPLEWLQLGNSPEVVAALAAEL